MARVPPALIALTLIALAPARPAQSSPSPEPAFASQAPAAASQVPTAASQTPAAAPQTPPTAATSAPPQEPYVYRPDGRRDPFVSLVGSGPEAKASRRGEGPTSLSVEEITVRGIMQSRGALVAMIQGADKKTYIVHPGDKLSDGTIKTITPQGLIVVQEVTDPLSLIKQREVRKLLRSLEDAKE